MVHSFSLDILVKENFCFIVENWFWCENQENSDWDFSILQPWRADSYHGSLRYIQNSPPSIDYFRHICRVWKNDISGSPNWTSQNW